MECMVPFVSVYLRPSSPIFAIEVQINFTCLMTCENGTLDVSKKKKRSLICLGWPPGHIDPAQDSPRFAGGRVGGRAGVTEGRLGQGGEDERDSRVCGGLCGVPGRARGGIRPAGG